MPCLKPLVQKLHWVGIANRDMSVLNCKCSYGVSLTVSRSCRCTGLPARARPRLPMSWPAGRLVAIPAPAPTMSWPAGRLMTMSAPPSPMHQLSQLLLRKPPQLRAQKNGRPCAGVLLCRVYHLSG